MLLLLLYTLGFLFSLPFPVLYWSHSLIAFLFLVTNLVIMFSSFSKDKNLIHPLLHSLLDNTFLKQNTNK
ncbi:MAG: hypothetical protein ABUK01_17355, partial [Leptospirales bacterium]